jgi:hypothetical protein
MQAIIIIKGIMLMIHIIIHVSLTRSVPMNKLYPKTKEINVPRLSLMTGAVPK